MLLATHAADATQLLQRADRRPPRPAALREQRAGRPAARCARGRLGRDADPARREAPALAFLARKSRTQLLWRFKWNLFFAAVTFLLSLWGVRLGYAVPAFDSAQALRETARGFFLVPFLDGHQYHLISKEALSDNWFAFKPAQTWLLYEVPAIVLPLLLQERWRART